MKSIKGLFVGMTLMAAMVVTLNASYAGEVQNRIDRQEKRIDQGVNSGELTPKEAGKLESKETKIEADRQQALSDGKMTRKERRKLNREENRQSRRIHHAKHNEPKAN